jgi:hypothetical protein
MCPLTWATKRTGCCMTTTNHLTLSFVIKELLTKNTTVIRHPPYFSLTTFVRHPPYFPLTTVVCHPPYFSLTTVIRHPSYFSLTTVVHHPPYFSLFPSWRQNWKPAILTQFRWSRQNSTQCWTSSNNLTSTMHFKTDRSTGKGAYPQKETPWRMMVARWPEVSSWPNGSISPGNYNVENL